MLGASRSSDRRGTQRSVVSMAVDNPSWGYTRLRDVLRTLGHERAYELNRCSSPGARHIDVSEHGGESRLQSQSDG